MELEKAILNLIQSNAKINTKTLATILDTEEVEVERIIAKMEQDRVIIGYNAIIDWSKIGQDGVTAMIDVKVTPEREMGFNRVAERICRFPEVRCVYLMSGTYDLSVVVTGNSMHDIARFVSHKLSTLEQVQSTTTHFILQRYKQDDFIFGDEEKDRRLVVSP